MNPQKAEHSFFSICCREKKLSGPAFTELFQAVLQRGKPFRFKATGFSMSPFIRDGDVLTIHPLAARPPVSGDVVAFIHPANSNIIIHRLVAIRDKFYRVKGDNTQKMSRPLLVKKLLGRVIRVERNEKRIFFGMGPERSIIAFLSRKNLLVRFLLPLRLLAGLLLKRTGT